MWPILANRVWADLKYETSAAWPFLSSFKLLVGYKVDAVTNFNQVDEVIA